LVVVDANKVFTSTAVDWALDHVAKPGDSLMLLGILQHSTNMGYKSWTDDIHWNGASKKLVDSELSNKRQLLQSNLELHLKCKNLGVSVAWSSPFSCFLQEHPHQNETPVNLVEENQKLWLQIVHQC
jgi:hypothetical protein